MPREALDAPESLPKEAPRQAVVRHVSPLETGAPPGRAPDRTGRAARSTTWPDRALQQRTVATPRRLPKKFDILFERRESPVAREWAAAAAAGDDRAVRNMH